MRGVWYGGTTSCKKDRGCKRHRTVANRVLINPGSVAATMAMPGRISKPGGSKVRAGTPCGISM